jgi:hypothetical protein
MNMKDYRIGNIIEEKEYPSEWKITTIDYLESGTHNGKETIIVNRRHLWGGEIEDVETRPIPLTEEWLLKFGFKHDHNGFVMDDKMSLSFSITKEHTEQ